MLTPTNMRAFAAVIEEGTFTAAATRLNATQSGISQQVAKLERYLGVRLIVREPHGAVPTPAGRQLYQRSVRILQEIAATEAGISGFRHGVSGSVRIGLMPAMTRSLAGPIQRRITSRHPNLRIVVVERVSSDLIDDVAAGRIDFGIVPVFNAPDAIRVGSIGRTREVLVHRGRRHENHMREVTLSDMSPLRLILQSSGNIRREAILARLKAANVDIVELIDIDSMFGTLEFVEHSEFATILPAIMMSPEIKHANLCVRPIRDPAMDLELIAIEPGSSEHPLITPILRREFSNRIAAFNHAIEAYSASVSAHRPPEPDGH